MPTEQQLLNMILGEGVAPNERETAIAALKRVTCKDRDGLVKKYTNDGAGVGGSEFSRGYEMWASEYARRLAAERELALEKGKLESAEMALQVTRQELLKCETKIRRLEGDGDLIHQGIPGTEERVAPASFKLDRKVRPIRPVEDVCADYGLTLAPTAALPDMPLGYPYWRPKRGSVFTSTCPICREMLWVNIHYQRWTCPKCDRRFPSRKQHAPDALGLVEHLTGCSYYNALWWCIGTGSQQQRKDSSASQADKPKSRRTKKKEVAA